MKYDKIIHVSDGSLAAVKNGVLWKIFDIFKSNEKEFQNALIAQRLPYNKPKLKGRDIIGGTNQAVCYEYIKGDDKDIEESIDKYIIKELIGEQVPIEIFQRYASYITDLHKNILKNKVPKANCYKANLTRKIMCTTLLSKKEKTEAMALLKSLPASDYLCHGDFTLGNILLKGEEAYAIDNSPLCRGPKFFDIAKFVYKVGEAHPRNVANSFAKFSLSYEDQVIKPNWEDILKLKLKHRKILVDEYLDQMNVSREQLEDYLYLLKASEPGEEKYDRIAGFRNHLHKYYPCIDEEYFNNLGHTTGTVAWKLH